MIADEFQIPCLQDPWPAGLRVQVVQRAVERLRLHFVARWLLSKPFVQIFPS
jgi:hypothetical protein